MALIIKLKTPIANSKATSEKKVQANQKNAQFSTGPNTLEGKRNSSRNALKHGLLTKNVVITGPNCGEKDRDFRLLLAGLRESHQPENSAQGLKVQLIAILYWQYNRSMRCERADIEIWSSPGESECEQPMINLLELEVSVEAYKALLKSSSGIETLISNVEVAHWELEDTGFVPKDVLEWLCPWKSWEDSVLPTKESWVAALDKYKRQLQTQHRRVKKEEIRKANAKRDMVAIPSKETLDRLHRYRTAILREIHREEASLRQMQAQSKLNLAKIGHEKTEILSGTASCETKEGEGTGVGHGSMGKVFPLSDAVVGG